MKNSLQSVTTLPVAVKMMKGIVIMTVVSLRYCYSHCGFLGIVIVTVVS